jgi:diguanylate cyclase (GGDEF)-like protein/PAS domain S-box-containing protein
MSIITVEEGRFLEVNEGFTELLGYEEGEVIGRRIVDLELVVERGIERDVVEQTADGGVVRGLETRLRRADGQQRDVLVWAKPIEIDGEACLLSAVQDITRRKRYERELEHQALHDELTGLPNQTLLRDRLDHALERAGSDGEELAVLLLDLDRFKLVNETMGHPVGDQLLIQVGDRLREAIRERDTVSRFGGDEFIVLLEGFGADDSVAPFVDPVVEVFETPFDLGGIEVHTTASIGIARSGNDVRDTDDLIRYADVAMYQAKSPEETTVTEYDPVGNHPVTERLHLENEMRRAVDRREFVTYFQPVIDIETGDVIGAEALARWEHPQEGLIAPGQFIPLAEETGMIVPIGEQILTEAAETVAGWQEQFGRLGEGRMFRLAVNLSARQYREENIIGQIRRAVDRSGLPLGSLVLEITESILMTGHGKLQELREDGVRVAIDDFGTGYSSLQYLRRLEADELKIDRSFIADLDEGGREDVLVEVILTMGRKFGMDVIAEGIETARQRGRLVELGCRFGQGFLYDRPLTADDFSVKYFETDGD